MNTEEIGEYFTIGVDSVCPACGLDCPCVVDVKGNVYRLCKELEQAVRQPHYDST